MRNFKLRFPLSLTTSGDGSQEGIVVITNTGNDDAILSLTNLKVTYSGAGRSTFTVDESSAAVIRTLAASRAALTDDSTVDEPEQPQEPEQPAEPEWQNPWQNLVNGIKNTVNYIGEKIQSCQQDVGFGDYGSAKPCATTSFPGFSGFKVFNDLSVCDWLYDDIPNHDKGCYDIPDGGYGYFGS